VPDPVGDKAAKHVRDGIAHEPCALTVMPASVLKCKSLPCMIPTELAALYVCRTCP
jgi:hypothetical protein